MCEKHSKTTSQQQDPSTEPDSKDSSNPAKDAREEGGVISSKSRGGKKISKMQIGTPSGILSITTTVEDSKINEIVLEKKAASGSESVNVDDMPNHDDIIRQSAAKSLNKKKEMIEAAVTDAIKQVNVPQTAASTDSKQQQEKPVSGH